MPRVPDLDPPGCDKSGNPGGGVVTCLYNVGVTKKSDWGEMAHTKHDVQRSDGNQRVGNGKTSVNKGKHTESNVRTVGGPSTPCKAMASRSALGGPLQARGVGKTVPGGLAHFTAIMSAPAGGVVPKRPHKYRPGTVALRQIRHYQRSTQLLMQKTPFSRWVRELLSDMKNDVRVRPETFECLQVSVEEYLVHLFEETQLTALHGKRVTLKIKDINLVKRIRNER